MTRIAEIIKNSERDFYPFCPNKDFYSLVKINSRRFAKIVRGELEPTLSEIKSIAKFFEIEITDLI